MRRRLRQQRQMREALLLDLGALVYELHRHGRREPELLQAKAGELTAVDDEVRALAEALDAGHTVLQLVSTGIAGSCEGCGALLSTSARFCSSCGAAALPALGADRAPAGLVGTDGGAQWTAVEPPPETGGRPPEPRETSGSVEGQSPEQPTALESGAPPSDELAASEVADPAPDAGETERAEAEWAAPVEAVESEQATQQAAQPQQAEKPEPESTRAEAAEPPDTAKPEEDEPRRPDVEAVAFDQATRALRAGISRGRHWIARRRSR